MSEFQCMFEYISFSEEGNFLCFSPFECMNSDTHLNFLNKFKYQSTEKNVLLLLSCFLKKSREVTECVMNSRVK